MARNFNKRNGARSASETINYSPAGKILHWLEPVYSAGVLVSGLMLLLCLSAYSSVSILSNLLLLGVLLGGGSKLYVHLMGMLKKPCKDPLAQLALLDLTIPEESVQEMVQSAALNINFVTSELRRLLLAENLYDSVKFGLVLYILTIFGAIFNTLTILVISWVLAFILPKVYEDNQDSVDELLSKVLDQFRGLDSKVAALLPGQVKVKEAVKEAVEKKE